MDSIDSSAPDPSAAYLGSADSPLDETGAVQREAEAGACAVRGEAARAAGRLALAQDRIAAARGSVGAGSGGPAGSDDAWGGFDDDDNLRSLLTPAVDRISRLAAIAAAMADGTLSDESAAESAGAVASAQPYRRPR